MHVGHEEDRMLHAERSETSAMRNQVHCAHRARCQFHGAQRGLFDRRAVWPDTEYRDFLRQADLSGRESLRTTTQGRANWRPVGPEIGAPGPEWLKSSIAEVEADECAP